MPITKRGSSKSNTTIDPKNKIAGLGIKKRIPAKEKLIYTSREGLLIVKTPAETTRWSNDFRLRIVTNYIAPRQLLRTSSFMKTFVESGDQEKIYKVSDRRVMVRQEYQLVQNDTYVVVLKTEVIDIDKGKAMFLYHDAPAMRCLMTYAFLKTLTVPGMPKLNIYEYDAKC